LAYLIAVVTERAFFIHAPEWVQFERYFPTKFNFRLGKCTALADSGKNFTAEVEKVAVRFDMSDDFQCKSARLSNFLNSSQEVIAFNSNQNDYCFQKVFQAAGYARRRGEESFHRVLFEALFDFPGPKLNLRMENFLNMHNIDLDKSLCLYVRSGAFHKQAYADSGCFYKNIDDNWRCAAVAEQAWLPLSKFTNITWVMLGDSDLHKAMATEYLESCSNSDGIFLGNANRRRRIVDTGDLGGLANIGEGGKSLSTLDRVFFDLHLMSRCRFLVASLSGYSGLAIQLHFNMAERKVMRVHRKEMLTNNMNQVCVPQ